MIIEDRVNLTKEVLNILKYHCVLQDVYETTNTISTLNIGDHYLIMRFCDWKLPSNLNVDFKIRDHSIFQLRIKDKRNTMISDFSIKLHFPDSLLFNKSFCTTIAHNILSFVKDY